MNKFGLKILELKDYYKQLIYDRWVQTTSSNLDEVYYDTDLSQLTVRFHDKKGVQTSAYLYVDVPENVYESLLSAPSKGHYFYYNIRTSYTYYKIN